MADSCSSASFTDIVVRREPAPGVCFRSALCVYDEVLKDGRWQGRYFQGAGYLEKEARACKLAQRPDVPSHAFTLQLDGQSLQAGWALVGIEELPVEQRGQRHVVVRLKHTVRPVSLAIHTRLDGTPVIERWLEITNTGKSPAALAEVSPWSAVLMEQGAQCAGFNAPNVSVGAFADARWGGEGDFRWRPLREGTVRLESRSGRSGFGAPFFVVRNEDSGEIAIGHLAWSGGWSAEFTHDFDSRSFGKSSLWFKAGPQAVAPQRLIGAGETLVAPAVHLGCLFGNLDDAIQAMHEHLRRSVLLPPLPDCDNLVVYNHWSYTEHELSEKALRHEMDVAADIGAELFVVDAGWYADSGTEWFHRVGDWTPGDRLPRGLKPVRDYARQKGLRFGLWMEPERIGRESSACKEHPEWQLRRDGDVRQSELDLTRPDVANWMEEQINRVVAEYELDLFRLDYNINTWEGGQRMHDGFIENTLWRHYEALYGIFDRLRQRFPKLILENCSSGGGRTDIGLVSRFHHTWVTDWQLAPRSARIVNGMTMSLPPEYVDRNVGVGQDGHLRGDLDFQIRSTVFGHMTVTGLHPLGVRPNPVHVGRFKHYVALYKNFVRPFLRSSRIYHHTPEVPGREPTGWLVLELAAADRGRAMVGAFRMNGAAEELHTIRLQGVSHERRYRVTYENSGQVAVLDGHTLMEQGLAVRLNRPLTSELLLLEAE